MTGIIESCSKSRADYFFIHGDDGIKYYGHRHQAIERKNYNEFCYKGNKVTFIPTEPEEEGKNHIANQIWFEQTPKNVMWKKEERERIMKIVWDVLHERVHSHMAFDPDWIYKQILNRADKMC